MNNLKIIAEIGSIHDGSFGNALKAVEAAVDCGANIVKFQTHIAESETLMNAPMPAYFKGEPRYDYFKRTAFSKNQWIEIKSLTESLGADFLSSPFSNQSVDLLEEIGVKYYKIPSGEVTNIPLLEKIVETGKEVILSTGMSNWKELDRAYEILKETKNLIILQCSSIYPCPNNNVGLNIMKEISERYKVKVGLSDHTLGFAASISAVALGAIAIEKHFTFSKLMYGSDAANSMEPNDFKLFTSELKSAFEIISNPVDKNNIKKYDEMKYIFQKSIVASKNLEPGTILNEDLICYKKPGDGIGAEYYKEIIGKELKIFKSLKGLIIKLLFISFFFSIFNRHS